MTALWFLYMTALFVVALVSCSLSLATWMPTRRRDCLAAATAFFIYAVGVALSVLGACGGAPEPLLVDAVLSALLAAAAWAWVLMRLHAPLVSARFVIPVVAYAAIVFLLVMVLHADESLQRFAYLLVRDLALFGLLSYTWWDGRRAKAKGGQLDYPWSHRALAIACMCAACVAAGDVLAYLMHAPAIAVPSGAQLLEDSLRWNIAEGAFMVLCAAWIMRADSKVLSWYFSHPVWDEALGSVEEPARAGMPSGIVDRAAPEADGAAQPIGEVSAAPAALVPTATAAGALHASVSPEELQQRILLYSDDHNLSPRERDVLEQMLAGKDIRNIASALVISPGTVKAHLHRIYRKAGVSRREDLVRDFWKS